MVHALGLPLLAYSSLLVAAVPYLLPGPVVIGSIFDARGRDVFFASYRLDRAIITIAPPAARTLDEAILDLSKAQATLLVGDGAVKHAVELEQALKTSVISPHFGTPRAGALIWLAHRFPDLGRIDDPAVWEPDYLRASGAERIAAQRAATTSTANNV
jgi:tRNA A37 threonylcarbamoyladenosine modification protein TsaB